MKYPTLNYIPYSERSKLPKVPGVYIFITDKGIPSYIGTSTDLNNRVCTHNRSEGAAYVGYFVKDIEDKEERLALETSLIKHYKPTLNVMYI